MFDEHCHIPTNLLPGVTVQVPAMTAQIDGLVKELQSLGYEAEAYATESASPDEGLMFYQFTGDHPEAGDVLKQVEAVARKYGWTGSASLAPVDDASTGFMVYFPKKAVKPAPKPAPKPPVKANH